MYLSLVNVSQMKARQSKFISTVGAKWIWLMGLVIVCIGVVRPAGAQIVINEILANNSTIAPLANNPDYFPDYVELYNNSDAPINLGTSGWRIGDSGTNYAFDANTTIPARGFLLVFCDSDTSVLGSVHTG